MKVFSYHTKMRLRKVLQVLGILVLTGLVIWICWLVWLQRYVVYTREGVTFNFGRSTLDLDGKETGPQAAGETAPGEILFQAAPQEAQNLARLSGVYVDGKQLEAGLDQVSQKLSALESGTAVLLDVKSKSGQFYYTSRIQGAPQSEALDCAAMDKLIQTLKEQGCYLIARLPAFRDSAFAEAKPGSGLTVSSGALWTDEAQCHWLDPANQAVTANLIQICRELQERGFDEVVRQTSAFRTVAPSPTPLPPLRMRSYGRPPGSWLPAPVRASRSPSPILGISPFPPVKPGCTWRTLPRSRPPALRKHALCPTAAPRWCSSPPARTPASMHTACCALWNDQPLLFRKHPSHPETSQPIALSRLRIFSSQKNEPPPRSILPPSHVIKSERKTHHGTEVQPAGGLGGLCPPL